jgi:4-amino-4-deoxy-L-arabinose transferase-like glycosyltransferase
MHSGASRADRTWILGCLGLAAVLRLFRIGHQNLWIDEMISLSLATYTTGAEFWRGLLHDIHGPFTSALLHLWTRLGTSEAWLRILYAVPSIATIPPAHALGRELFGERAGRATAVVFAASPFLVWYAQEIRAYSWAVLWATWALLLFVRILDGRAGGRTWPALLAVVVLGVLTNYGFVFLLASLTAALAVLRPPRGVALRWAGVLLATAVVFLPWFVDWYQRIGAERVFLDTESPTGVPLREAEGFTPFGLGYTVWAFTFGYSLGPTLRSLHLDRSAAAILAHWPVLALGGAAVAVALGFGIREAARRGRGRMVAVLLGVPLLLAILLAVRGVKTFHPRYLFACLPAFLAIVAAGWSVPQRGARVAAACAAVLAALSLANHYFVPAYAKEDSRAAAKLILEQERPGDSVVVIYAFRPFRYYFSDTADGAARLHHVHKRYLRTDEEMRVHVADASRDAARVWLVLSRWWDVAPEPRIRRFFEESLAERGRWDFEGVKVTLYEGGPR